MAQQFRILLEIYYRPHAAFCRVLDEGKFFFALIAALAAAVLLARQTINSTVLEQLPPAAIPFYAVVPGVRFLFFLAGLYVPAAMIVVILWDSLGGVATILRRDYLPVLTCHLFSYTASLILLTGLRLALGLSVFWIAFLFVAVYFLFLSISSLRAVMGTTPFRATVAMFAACVAASIGSFAYGLLGAITYYLTSPFLLYYAYRFFQGDISIIGSGLSSRQNLRRQLEAAKLNPRDADAHYQIGLIQMQRRQYSEAEASFKRAIAIAPDDADSYFQFAKIAREQGRLDEAINALRKTAELDDKHSLSEVWRDLGAVALLATRLEEAEPALAKYVQRRPYDPEGLYWYGKILKQLGQPAAAKEALEQSLEAVETAPSHQRGKLRKWASEAKTELKSL